MKHIHFFALKADLLAVLDAVEHEGALDYVRISPATQGLERFAHGAELPNVGEADNETGSVCDALLVVTAGTPVTIRHVDLASGGQRSFVDQLLNPDSVALTPAGLWRGSVLLNGQVGTASNSSTSQLLMRRFSKAFTKQFTTVKVFQVGPQALAMLRSGGRLTRSAQSPREYDLIEAAARPGAKEAPSDRKAKKKPADKRKPVPKKPGAKKKH